MVLRRKVVQSFTHFYTIFSSYSSASSALPFSLAQFMESTEADVNRPKEGCPVFTQTTYFFVLLLFFCLLSGSSYFDIDQYFLYEC